MSGNAEHFQLLVVIYYVSGNSAARKNRQRLILVRTMNTNAFLLIQISLKENSSCFLEEVWQRSSAAASVSGRADPDESLECPARIDKDAGLGFRGENMGQISVGNWLPA